MYPRTLTHALHQYPNALVRIYGIYLGNKICKGSGEKFNLIARGELS